jgi:sterol desaturase/sphingolipid hydroxylase (fatty acid hydroxylase superfamily)
MLANVSLSSDSAGVLTGMPGEPDFGEVSRGKMRNIIDNREPSVTRFGAFQRTIGRLSSTRINSWLGLAADFTVSLFLLGAGIRLHESHVISALYVVSAGVLAFSFVEYCFHRWLFHGSAPMFEQGHHRHHELPLGHDSLPFFFPPLAMLALAELMSLAGPRVIALLFTGGFAAGYAAYGLSHTVIHRMRFQNVLVRRWASAHHIHHHHPGSNFGVTSPLWDIVMRTRYVRREPKDAI